MRNSDNSDHLVPFEGIILDEDLRTRRRPDALDPLPARTDDRASDCMRKRRSQHELARLSPGQRLRILPVLPTFAGVLVTAGELHNVLRDQVQDVENLVRLRS